MKSRTILLIDNDQSTRRHRALMLLTHGYLVSSVESLAEVNLPFDSPPDLVLLRVDEPPDGSNSAFALIRNIAPGQRIGFLLDDGHKLCQLFVDGMLVRPQQSLAADLIASVETMLGAQSTGSMKMLFSGAE